MVPTDGTKRLTAGVIRVSRWTEPASKVRWEWFYSKWFPSPTQELRPPCLHRNPARTELMVRLIPSLLDMLQRSFLDALFDEQIIASTRIPVRWLHYACINWFAPTLIIWYHMHGRVILFFSMLFALPSPEIRAIWLHFEQTCPCFEVVNVTLISQIGWDCPFASGMVRVFPSWEHMLSTYPCPLLRALLRSYDHILLLCRETAYGVYDPGTNMVPQS